MSSCQWESGLAFLLRKACSMNRGYLAKFGSHDALMAHRQNHLMMEHCAAQCPRNWTCCCGRGHCRAAAGSSQRTASALEQFLCMHSRSHVSRPRAHRPSCQGDFQDSLPCILLLNERKAALRCLLTQKYCPIRTTKFAKGLMWAQ